MDTLFHNGNFPTDLLFIGDLSSSKSPPSGLIHNFDGLLREKSTDGGPMLDTFEIVWLVQCRPAELVFWKAFSSSHVPPTPVHPSCHD